MALNGRSGYSQFVKCLVTSTGATAAAIWNCDRIPFVPVAQYVHGEAVRVELSEEHHRNLLSQIAKQQRSAVVKTDSTDNHSPTFFWVPLAGPVNRVLELFFCRDHNVGDPQALLKQLDQLRHTIERAESTSVVDELKPEQSQLHSDVSSTIPSSLALETLSQYARAIHRSIDLGQTCASIANESRLVLNCDRVSVALWKRGRYRIVSISGQPSVNHRSNTVQVLEKLADQILKTKSEFWYPSDHQAAPQIRSILDEYLGISTTRSLTIQPIHQRVDEMVEDPESLTNRPNQVIGGILFEHFQAEWNCHGVGPTLGLLKDHASAALRNALQYQQIFLLPLWRLIGKSQILASARVLPKTVLLSAAALAFMLFLVFWPVEFYVSASGVLVPQQRQLIFPEVSGLVASVQAAHGQAVRPSDTLIVLQSEELQLRIADVSGRIATLSQRKSSIERNKFQTARTSGVSEFEENLRSLQAELDALHSQLHELEKLQDKLQIKSPMDGQVITWDVQQKLTGRSVTPQNALMEIANIEGPWQLELEVEDHKIQHLFRGLTFTDRHPLKVQFTLSADPRQSYEGTLIEISNAMALNSDSQQVMRVKVNIDKDVLPVKQAGSSVSAKIYTGKTTSAGYLWLHQIPETLNRYIFFYFVR